ncbi:MAG: PIN domain-containing protein [Candidatus Xenobia bacterium]
MHFLDTNILLYSISTDGAESRKREQAIALLDRDYGALSVQVLQEFYVQATRASRTHPLSHDLAVALMRTWYRFTIQPVTTAILDRALQLRSSTGFSYWDCAVVAAALALECHTLYSEDLSHGRVVKGVTIVNPFL